MTRDFVRSCQTPVLVLPDDTAGHSLEAAIESAMLAPNGSLVSVLLNPQLQYEVAETWHPPGRNKLGEHPYPATPATVHDLFLYGGDQDDPRLQNAVHQLTDITLLVADVFMRSVT